MEIRIGVDLGGTKIEAIALGNDHTELLRRRVDTPRDDYRGTLGAIVELVGHLGGRAGSPGFRRHRHSRDRLAGERPREECQQHLAHR